MHASSPETACITGLLYMILRDDPQLIIAIYAARPCQRCIKRGMADNCIEGHRKKAKYLLDEEELGMSSMIFTVLSRSN